VKREKLSTQDVIACVLGSVMSRVTQTWVSELQNFPKLSTALGSAGEGDQRHA